MTTARVTALLKNVTQLTIISGSATATVGTAWGLLAVSSTNRDHRKHLQSLTFLVN